MRRAITFLLAAAAAAGPVSAQAWIGAGQGPERPDYGDRQRARDIDRADPARPPGRGWNAAGRPDPARAHAGGDPRDGWSGNRPGGGRSPGGDPNGWRDGRGPAPDGHGPDRYDGAPPRPGDRAGWSDRRSGGPRPDYRWSENRRGGWDRGWRDDRRFDWQGYRGANRALFRAPRYYGPRGYDYVRWSPGYRVDPRFYGQNYWIADPWRYRLPPAYGSYRWVRYYDDVALVDIRSGLIEDILYGLFWR